MENSNNIPTPEKKQISNDQFLKAIEKCKNGGKSKMIDSREVMPYSWCKGSRGHYNLIGKKPLHSIFLRNDGLRGGADKTVFLEFFLKSGYEIVKTKKEIKTEERIKKAKNLLYSKIRKEKKAFLLAIAKKHGFKNISELNKANNEIKAKNVESYRKAAETAIARFESETGQKYKGIIHGTG